MRRQLTMATIAARQSARTTTAATTIPSQRTSLLISPSPRARAPAASRRSLCRLPLDRSTKAAPGLFVVTVDEKWTLGFGRRQDRQERHRLLRGVVNRVHDVLANERALPRFERPLLAIHPLLRDAIDHVDDLFARRVIVKPVAGAGPHRDPDQRELLRVGEARSRQPPVLAPGRQLDLCVPGIDETKRVVRSCCSCHLITASGCA